MRNTCGPTFFLPNKLKVESNREKDKFVIMFRTNFPNVGKAVLGKEGETILNKFARANILTKLSECN